MGGRTTCHVQKNIFIPFTIRFNNHKDWTKYYGSKAICSPLYEQTLLMYEGAFLKDNSIQGPCLEVSNTGFHVFEQLFDLVT